MIEYPTGAYGFLILFRVHGSAVYKALTPALLSSVVFGFLYYFVDIHSSSDVQLLQHPYPMTALISAFTFLLSFRANFAYNRYWEAYTAVYQMHSKWLDVGTELAAFHLQATRYADSRPPTFGENPHLTSVERERERNEKTFEEIENHIDETIEKEKLLLLESTTPSRWFSLLGRTKRRRKKKKKNQLSKQNDKNQNTTPEKKNQEEYKKKTSYERQIYDMRKSMTQPSKSTIPKKKKKMNWGHRRQKSCVTTPAPVPEETELDERPLFLQESAHLLSLLSAVAMSTLRNDLEHAESPLTRYEEGVCTHNTVLLHVKVLCYGSVCVMYNFNFLTHYIVRLSFSLRTSLHFQM